jgi:hypothetical protein
MLSEIESHERQIGGQLIMNVKGVSDDGTVTLEIVRHFRITEGERSEDTPAPPAEVQLRPTGEILKTAGEKVTYLLVQLPNHPVAINESWTYGNFVGIAGIEGFLVVTRTLTLIGVEQWRAARRTDPDSRGEPCGR